MDRRRLLATAAAGLLGGLPGCGAGIRERTATPETGGATGTATAADETETADDQSIDGRLHNRDDEPRRFELRISGADGDPRDGEWEVPAGDTTRLPAVGAPGDTRTVEVAVDGASASATLSFDVDRSPDRVDGFVDVAYDGGGGIDIAFTPASMRLELDGVDAADVEGTVAAYPADLRAWLRRAATADVTLRKTAEVDRYAPDPPLQSFDAVRLIDRAGEPSDGGDADGTAIGTYELDVDAGPHYELLVGAEAVDSVPDGETATPVGSLADDRRKLIAAAIDGERPRVEPQTELGEWAREEFFGGYVTRDGDAYRGHEIRQTDAAFFSTTAWYVLALRPTDAVPEATVDVGRVPDPVAEALDPLVAGEEDRDERRVRPVPYRLVEWAEATDAVLTHDALCRVRLCR